MKLKIIEAFPLMARAAGNYALDALAEFIIKEKNDVYNKLITKKGHDAKCHPAGNRVSIPCDTPNCGREAVVIIDRKAQCSQHAWGRP